MSRILERLKEAEEQRQRIVAERKQLEAEADAALQARERESEGRVRAEGPTQAQPAARTKAVEGAIPAPARHFPWFWAAVALAFMASTGLLLVEKEKAPAVKMPTEAAGSVGLKLDRDVDAFAARVSEKEKE